MRSKGRAARVIFVALSAGVLGMAEAVGRDESNDDDTYSEREHIRVKTAQARDLLGKTPAAAFGPPRHPDGAPDFDVIDTDLDAEQADAEGGDRRH